MPANDYYDSSGTPSSNSSLSSASIRSEFNLIETGFTAAQAALALKANLTSPTLVTPNLGTPSALVGTNITGTAAGLSIGGNAATATLATTATNATNATNASTVTTNANLTGHVTSVGNAAVLGSFTLAQLNTAISNADVATGGGTATGTNTGDQTNITGNAATVTTNANLTGDVTSIGNATTLTNAPVIAKVLTGYTSGAGTVAATDSILQAIQKLNGNDALKANLASPTFTGTVTIPTPFTLGAVSVLPTGTELNFVDGVTSNIQTQFTGKASLASPTFIGTVTTDVLTTTGQFNLTGDLIKSRSESGADSWISVANTSNTASSGALIRAEVAGALAGDAYSNYSVAGTAWWSVGLDNSDSDKFKISAAVALGAGDALIITTAGLVEIPGGLFVSGGTSAQGTIWKGAVFGIQIRGVTGSGGDFSLFDAAGTQVLVIPPSSGGVSFAGWFGRGAPVTKTADFTVASTENWLINNKAASTCTVTLPTASTFGGREIMINNYQAFTVVSASSNVITQTGTGPGTAILAATAGKWATLVSNGTNWVIMQSN